MSSFRLKSSTMFSRDEEGTETPLRIVFLSVEGNKTEEQYFGYVEKYRNYLGIKTSVHIHPLKRAKNDNLSAPEQVLELLEEYIEIRNSENLPNLLKDVIPKDYSYDFVERYLKGEYSKKDVKVRKFEFLLHESGIDLAYNHFLNEYQGENDVFGIVIDRDYKSHPLSQMLDIISRCKTQGYKCYVTNPLFEFWLLLHLIDIKKTLPNKIDNLLINDVVSKKHTLVSKIVSDIAGHAKGISEKVFVEKYLPKIDYAISQTKDCFSINLDKLIGDDSTEKSMMGELGSNLPELFDLLREI